MCVREERRGEERRGEERRGEERRGEERTGEERRGEERRGEERRICKDAWNKVRKRNCSRNRGREYGGPIWRKKSADEGKYRRMAGCFGAGGEEEKKAAVRSLKLLQVLGTYCYKQQQLLLHIHPFHFAG